MLNAGPGVDLQVGCHRAAWVAPRAAERQQKAAGVTHGVAGDIAEVRPGDMQGPGCWLALGTQLPSLWVLGSMQSQGLRIAGCDDQQAMQLVYRLGTQHMQ